MTFEERVKTALADMHFANLQLQHQIQLLKDEVAQYKKSNGGGAIVEKLKDLAAKQNSEEFRGRE